MNSLSDSAFSLLGRRAQKKRDKYADLRNDLMSARFKVSFEVYLSTIYLASLIAGIVAAVVLGIVTYLFNLPEMVTYHGEAPESLVPLPVQPGASGPSLPSSSRSSCLPGSPL